LDSEAIDDSRRIDTAGAKQPTAATAKQPSKRHKANTSDEELRAKLAELHDSISDPVRSAGMATSTAVAAPGSPYTRGQRRLTRSSLFIADTSLSATTQQPPPSSSTGNARPINRAKENVESELPVDINDSNQPESTRSCPTLQ